MEKEQEFYNYGENVSNPNIEMAILSELIEVERDLQKFEMEVLRGLIQVRNIKSGRMEWKAIAPNSDPPVNELGVRGIMSLMRGAATKLSKLSNKTDDEIKDDMFFFHMALVEQMYYHHIKWQLKKTDAAGMKESAIRLVWDVAASSRDGFTAINIKSQYNLTQSSNINSDEQKSKTLWGIPLPGGKK